MIEMSLSMRVPSVAPRGADVVGSLKVGRGGTAVGETREEGGCFILIKMFARIILINFSFILAFALVFEFVKDFRCADCAVAQRG